MFWFILILAFSAILRAVSHIAVFRKNRTWLPSWFVKKDGKFNFDGFHLISNGHWILALLAGWFACRVELNLLIWAIPIWFGYGNFFSLWYHVLFMKPQYRECWICDWFKEFFDLFRREIYG